MLIITKTPFRISFFGGGTDFPEWFEKNNGLTISTTINKYCNILVRYLPPFFDFNYRLRYYQTELVKNKNHIKHPTIKKIIQNYYKSNQGLEVIHYADLPARSGLGASSAFSVGLLKAIYELNKKKISNKEIADKIINLEKYELKESCGFQDQVSCSNGGFNEIYFSKKKKFNIIKSQIPLEKKKLLEQSISLFFTGISRNANNIEKNKIKNIFYNKNYFNEIYNLALEAKNIFNSNNKKDFIKDISYLMNENWKLKKSLSRNVTNRKIDDLYDFALKNGACSGKILGAGGGGFLLFFTKNLKDKKRLIEKMSKYIYVEIKFSEEGCKSFIY
jgi:D-glycero-alpha-D-manno-heptose-7-phosphate kinase